MFTPSERGLQLCIAKHGPSKAILYWGLSCNAAGLVRSHRPGVGRAGVLDVAQQQRAVHRGPTQLQLARALARAASLRARHRCRQPHGRAAAPARPEVSDPPPTPPPTIREVIIRVLLPVVIPRAYIEG